MAQARAGAARGRFPRLGALRRPAVPLVRAWFETGWAREIEQRRLFPWLAVAFALGILAFFAGTQGPPHLAAPLVAAIALAALTPLLAARPFTLGLVLAGIAAFLGFAAATLRVQRVAGPILARTTIAHLVGTIEGLDERWDTGHSDPLTLAVVTGGTYTYESGGGFERHEGLRFEHWNNPCFQERCHDADRVGAAHGMRAICLKNDEPCVGFRVTRREDKVRAGAQFAMTQPIFNPDLARLTFDKTKHLGIPVFVGVMPLLNARNTEFLHNEVPGIVIPDEIREKMRGREGTDGNAIGLQFARELCDVVLEHFAGIYLITPLMRFDLTVELSSHVRRQTDK